MVEPTDMGYTKMKILFTGDSLRITISMGKVLKKGRIFTLKEDFSLTKKLKEL